MGDNQPALLLETDPVLGTVLTLNRPSKSNAVNMDMLDDLITAVSEVSESEGILIKGRGSVTCGGADTTMLESQEFNEQYILDKTGQLRAMLHEHSGPTVVAADGALIGLGFSIGLECDFIVLGEETVLQFPEVQLGFYNERTTQLIEHLQGASIAKRIVLSGEPLPPTTALHSGLVYDVVPEEKVNEIATGLLKQLNEYDAEIVEKVNNTLRFDTER